LSWRAGSELFAELWPLVQANITDPELRKEFTAELLQLFVANDMDPYDVEDIDPEIRAAMRRAGLDIAEPERYASDPPSATVARRRRPWWRPW
jgi:hypothetical protein